MADISELLNGYTGDGTPASIQAHIKAQAAQLGYKVFIDDGKKDVYIPKARLDNVLMKNTELENSLAKMEGLKSKIAKLNELADDNATAKKTIDTLNTELANMRKAVQSNTIKSEIARQTEGLLGDRVSIDDIYDLLDKDSLTVNANNEVIGLKAAIAAMQQNKPYLFKPMEDPNAQQGQQVNGFGFNQQVPGGQPYPGQGQPQGMNVGYGQYNPYAGYTGQLQQPTRQGSQQAAQGAYQQGAFGAMLAQSSQPWQSPQAPNANPGAQAPQQDPNFNPYFND